MLRNVTSLLGVSILAKDGNIGHVRDVLLTIRAGFSGTSSSRPETGFRADEFSSRRSAPCSRNGKDGSYPSI